jgi:hypothetical protein
VALVEAKDALWPTLAALSTLVGALSMVMRRAS